ncbi:MAG: response regulator [Turicibacter sp.]|nr:response regulator [Turicibacter sp.]
MITLLIVEDTKEILDHLERLIRRSFQDDFQILKAETFQEAKVIIENDMVEVFIIDFDLPDGDGLDLIKLIRNYYSRKHPIIVQTVRDDTTYQLDVYKSYGNIVYLTKDVVFDELIEQLANIKEDLREQMNERLVIPGKSIVEAIDMREICLVSKVLNSNNLEITSYNHSSKDFKYNIITNMSFDGFLEAYNTSDLFIRCHKSHVINKKMIEKIDRRENWVVLKHKNMKIELGEAYKKDVLTAVRGVI